MLLRFRAAYAPTGNSIVERNHQTAKVIAARKQCSITKAAHLYNVTPRDGTTMTEAPARGVYSCEVHDCVRPTQEQRAVDTTPGNDGDEGYNTGVAVWMRNCEK